MVENRLTELSHYDIKYQYLHSYRVPYATNACCEINRILTFFTPFR